MSQHIQCGMLKTSAAVRPLHNPTTLIKQIQNLQTIHVNTKKEMEDVRKTCQRGVLLCDVRNCRKELGSKFSSLMTSE